MVPRTAQRKAADGGTWGAMYEAYRCLTRIRNLEACDQRPLPRAAVDAAALAALTERGISVEQTRAQMTAAVERDRRDAHARVEEAVAEQQHAAQRLARIERDYTDGSLSAANYERLSARLAEELDAASAQRAQAERHAENLDARSNEAGDAVVAAMSDVHEAIAAFMGDARHLDELRLRLRQLFERFTVEDDGDTVALVPTVRAEALDTVLTEISALRREAVRATTDANALAT